MAAERNDKIFTVRKLEQQVSDLEKERAQVEKQFEKWNHTFQTEQQKSIEILQKQKEAHEKLKLEAEGLRNTIEEKNEKIKEMGLNLSSKEALLAQS